MKGKNRGILILSFLILVVLAFFLRTSLISQPRVENDTPDISIVRGQDNDISTRDNNEIEDKEPIPSENIDIKELIKKVQDNRIIDKKIVNEQENLKDNQEAISPISNKQGDKESDREVVKEPDEVENKESDEVENKESDEEKDHDKIKDPSPQNPILDEDLPDPDPDPDPEPDPDPDPDPDSDTEPDPDPDESNSSIQDQQEDTDDSYGPIVSGK